MSWRVYIAAFLFAVVGLFILQNMRSVEVRFLFWEIAMSRALLLFAVLGIGAFAGWLIGTFRSR